MKMERYIFWACAYFD
uniref:Uncharacterized protein n=1 Tax=Lepeophtheirus salmonis TaxID=72036 RepID=A0A0K2UEV9_LEPSM